MKERTVYKVVVDVYGDSSCYISVFSRGYFLLNYAIGEETVPKVGKLFVFDSLENARNFLSNPLTLFGQTILVGTAKNVSRPKKICDFTERMRDFWTKRKCKKSVASLSGVPIKGTLFCDSFIPEKVVI